MAFVAALSSVAALLLQGCGPTQKACKISDIYGLIQVDGRTGLSKTELARAGVQLCARHLRKEETYSAGACTEPEQVFAGGELPTPSNGDSNALLLVRCPSSAYPKGKELQRVTCSDDFMGEMEDGTIEKAVHLRFDNYEIAANCLLAANTTLEMDAPDEQPQTTILAHDGQNHTAAGNMTDKSAVNHMPSKVMRSSNDIIALVGSRGRRTDLLIEIAAAAAASPLVLARSDVDIHPHGTRGSNAQVHQMLNGPLARSEVVASDRE